MKITITSGGVVVVLGDDVRKEAISGFAPRSTTQVELAALLRAPGVTPFDRKNIQTVLTWRTDRVHAHGAAALKWVMDHFRTLPRQGTIEISQQGGASFSCWLQDAVIQQMAVLSLDASSVIQYEIVGGQLLATNPG